MARRRSTSGEVAAAIAAATLALRGGPRRRIARSGCEPLAARATGGSRSASCRRTARARRRCSRSALYDGLEPGLHSQIEAMKLALADTLALVARRPAPGRFFADEPPRRAARPRPAGRSRRRRASTLPRGGTTYLCVVDGDGMAVSLIQSLYGSFGSGVVAAGHGHRAAEPRRRLQPWIRDHPNALAPGQAAVPHDHPRACCSRTARSSGPFGVMGGPMQPQGHFQVVRRLVDVGDDPQAALDAPRWRVEEDGVVEVEPGLARPRLGPSGVGHDARVERYSNTGSGWGR